MSATNRALSLSSLCVFLLTISTLATPSTSAVDSFVFGGCSQLKYMPGSPYENNVNSILASLVNSAMFTSYNNFTAVGTIGTTSSNPQDTVSGLFQCRGDLQPSDCARCVARAVTQLGTLCIDSCGGALQLDGCLVKYDNATFLGVEDKTVVVKKCGPPVSYDSNSLAGRDAVLTSLEAGDGGPYKTFRTGTSGNLQGVAQCVGDLSPSECTDCLADAIGRLKTECGPAAWGDMFLAKCYVRFSEGGVHSHGGKDDDSDTNSNDDEVEKTLAIIIGLIAAVALFIVFISFLNKLCEKGKGGK